MSERQSSGGLIFFFYSGHAGERRATSGHGARIHHLAAAELPPTEGGPIHQQPPQNSKPDHFDVRKGRGQE